MTDLIERCSLTHKPDSSSPEMLLYYDGPVLLWLPVAGRHLLAYALPSEGPDEDLRNPFVVIELSEKHARRFAEGKATLSEAVSEASARFYLPDYYAEDLVLRRVDGPLPGEWEAGDLRLTPSDTKLPGLL